MRVKLQCLIETIFQLNLGFSIDAQLGMVNLWDFGSFYSFYYETVYRAYFRVEPYKTIWCL